MSKVKTLEPRNTRNLDTPTDLSPEGVKAISAALNVVLADSFALYLKTKNFHWHVSGPHFRDYHLLLDEHAMERLGPLDDYSAAHASLYRRRTANADTVFLRS